MGNFVEDCGNKPRADGISISYLQAERDFGEFYTKRQCFEYGKVRTLILFFSIHWQTAIFKLSLMGTTFLISSGDTGVAGFNKKCTSKSGLQL